MSDPRLSGDQLGRGDRKAPGRTSTGLCCIPDGRGEPFPPGASRLPERTRRAEISLVGWPEDRERRLCPEDDERGDGECQDCEPISHLSLPHGVVVMSRE